MTEKGFLQSVVGNSDASVPITAEDVLRLEQMVDGPRCHRCADRGYVFTVSGDAVSVSLCDCQPVQGSYPLSRRELEALLAAGHHDGDYTPTYFAASGAADDKRPVSETNQRYVRDFCCLWLGMFSIHAGERLKQGLGIMHVVGDLVMWFTLFLLIAVVWGASRRVFNDA